MNQYKFKVGDRFIVTNSNSAYYKETGTIDQNNSVIPYVTWDNIQWNIYNSCMSQDDIELFKKDKPEVIEYDIAIGDKVISRTFENNIAGEIIGISLDITNPKGQAYKIRYTDLPEHYNYHGRALTVTCYRDEITKVESGNKIKITKQSLINKIKTMTSTFIKKVLDKDLQTLIKVGYLNSDLSISPKGEQKLRDILFLENKDKLVKEAEEEIKEAKEEKN